MTDAARRPAYVMEPLAALPVFLKLAGRAALIAGGGPPAVWKAELLAAAGAWVTVLAEAPCPEMVELATRLDDSIHLIGRRWTPEDLPGAALAIGAIEEQAEAAAFQEAAQGAGVPVNVIDKPDYCDFQFGTIVARSPLLIGISTQGAAPVFGQAIRARIEALLPQSLRAWAEAARDWRLGVQARGFGFRERRRFWEAFAERALAAAAPPADVDREACFAAASGSNASLEGAVTLVGSGSGKPEALTLAAISALQNADVILYDRDVQDTTVGFGRREAQKVAVIDDKLAVERTLIHTTEGRRVVWLGTGNPLVDQRWFERATALFPTPVSKVEGLAYSGDFGASGDGAAPKAQRLTS